MQPGMRNILPKTARVRRASTIPSSLHSGHSFFCRPCNHAGACSQHECPPDTIISKLCVLHHCYTNTDVTCCFCSGLELVRQLVSVYHCSQPRVSVSFRINQAPDSNIPSNSNSSIIHQQRLLLNRHIARRSSAGWHP